MKKFYFVLTAGAVLLAACAKEQMAPVSETTILNLSIEEPKTVLGELTESNTRPIYWQKGDSVCCNGIVSKPLADVEENARNAKFEFNSVLSTPYNLLYPASMYKTASTVELPSIAKYIPMAGQGASMKAVTGIIKLSIQAGEDKDKIASVVVTSPSQQLSGVFDIDYQSGELSGMSNDIDDRSVKMNVSKTLPEEGALELFIPVPAGEYEFTVRIIDVCGHYMEKATTAAKTIVAGQVSAFPALTFTPTGTQVDVEITSAADLVKFAQDWNAGKFDYNPVVVLANDIEFDAQTSADFVATGGIGIQGDDELGTHDIYFNGCFDGAGHIIKGYVSMSGDVAAPLFAFSGSASIIKDLTLDTSCNLSFPKGNAAPFVGRHKGRLINCVNNADVNLAMVAGTTYFGGLVGRVYEGSIEGCKMNGNIVNATDAGSTKPYKVGGLAGTLEAGGTISDSEFNGYTKWHVQPVSGASGPQLKNGTLYMGGIVGDLMGGTVSGCTCTPSSNEDNSDIRGNAGTCAIGGIAGNVQAEGKVINCTNNNIIYIRLSSGTVLNTGGIAGNNEGCLEKSTNTAKVTANGGHLTINHGGVAGRNAGTVSGSTNSGQIVGPSQYSTVTSCCVGGIIGLNNGAASDCGNTGSVGSPYNNALPISYIGGAIGLNEAGVTTSAVGLDNSGKVTGPTTDCAEIYVGGICGGARADMSECTNAGAVTLAPATAKTTYTKYVSGGVGIVNGEDVTLDQLTNTGTITFEATTKQNGRSNHLGGIVACVNAGGVVISNCVNEGVLKNSNFNNTYTLAGGAIMGGIVGVSLGTEEKPVLIEACVNQKGTFQGQRGIAGGVVGYIDHTKVSGCSNTQNTGAISANITFNSSAICGWAVNSVIEHTSANCDINQKNSAPAKFGGVVSKLDAGCLLDDCSFSGKVTIQYADGASAAGIANTSVAGSTIKNCKFGGTYSLDGGTTYSAFKLADICTDANFTDGGGNALL